MTIDTNWTFKELVDHIRQIKKEYQEVCNSFNKANLDEFNQRIRFRRAVKDTIYSMPYSNERKDNIWLYLHNEVGIGTLKSVKK